MRLQFAVPRSGGERRHVAADGGQSFGVSVEHDGGDEAVGRAHGDAHVHHVVPEGGAEGGDRQAPPALWWLNGAAAL